MVIPIFKSKDHIKKMFVLFKYKNLFVKSRILLDLTVRQTKSTIIHNDASFRAASTQVSPDIVQNPELVKWHHARMLKHTNVPKTYKIVMVRHGESEWNKKNLFCGWYDAKLSKKGEEEAVSAGKALKQAGYKFDLAHTSVLTRAHITLHKILKEIDQMKIPIFKTWRLNERHYGALTGLNKSETAKKYGEKQVQIWRRSFDTPPPPMDEKHNYYKTIVNDPRYNDGPSRAEFPMFESLELTIKRTMPYWNDVIVPQIKEGKSILIAAHGNSLRGIVKHLDKISNDAIMGLNLPTGIPFVYELDLNMKPVPNGSLKFLGDEETVRKAMEAVAAQGKAK